MAVKLFTFGKPVVGDDFIGREKETDRLVSNFKYGISTFILSPRRLGKTSLVINAMDVAKSDKLKIVFVDVFNCKNEEQFCEKLSNAVLTQTSGKFDEILKNATEFIGRITFDLGVSPDPFNPVELKFGLKDKSADIADMLSLPQKITTKQGIDLVICIDEFQQIGEFKDTMTFQKILRSEWQHQQNVTYCLIGSKRHMVDSDSKPFYKFGDVIYLDSIQISCWKKYIQQRFERGGKKINDLLCTKVCELVGLNSSYVQQLSWYLFQETSSEATEDGLSKALDELIHQNSPIFQLIVENVSAYQMNYLRAVASGVTSNLSSAEIIRRYKLGSSANVAAISKQMKEKDLVQITAGKVTLTDSVFGLWLLRN